MKHTTFSRTDKLKAMAIVHVFETGKPFGDYAACAVLDDGAGISYGINQFTHRSGSLLAVVEKYLASGCAVGRDVIADRLPGLRKTSISSIEKLSADSSFKKAIQAASITGEMRAAQESVVFERYLAPALDECESLGFARPHSLAVVYDSFVHGSWQRIRDRIKGIFLLPERQPRDEQAIEKKWIIRYLQTRDAWLEGIPRLRKTAYRTDFFLAQVARGNWTLSLPLNVHGVQLTEEMFRDFDRAETVSPDVRKDSPVEPDKKPANDVNDKTPSQSSDTPRPQRQTHPAVEAQPAEHEEVNYLGEIETSVNAAAARYDQVERIAKSAVTRTDSAKSLWTTVGGTCWQMAWAVGGFISGVPREVWLVVAVAAAALMLIYLYRQIELGRIRELQK